MQIFLKKKLSFLVRQKKEAPKRSFPEIMGLSLLLVVLLAADVPEVGLHGLLAVGEVLLGEEGGLVLGDLGQVFLTLDDHLSDRLEAETDSALVVRERSGTVVAVFACDIDTNAVRVLRCGYAVRTDEVGAVLVAGFLDRFGHRAAYVLDTVCILYNCHNCEYLGVSK